MRRLEACYFGEGDQGRIYDRMARVLEHTSSEHCPDWKISVEHLAASDLAEYRAASGNDSHVWNTWKLEHWRKRLKDAPDDSQVLLIDGDMMILRPLDPVWRLDFDVAYTIREQTGLPLNGGVIFARVSDRTRRFMEQWWTANLRFLNDYAEHNPWRRRYAGINQAALGYLLEKVDHGCSIRQLVCSEWNCCEWNLYDPATTRIVHVKSGLRRAVFGLQGGAGHRPKVAELVKVWRRLERKAQAVQEVG